MAILPGVLAKTRLSVIAPPGAIDAAESRPGFSTPDADRFLDGSRFDHTHSPPSITLVLDAVVIVAGVARQIALVMLPRIEHWRRCRGRVYGAVRHSLGANFGSARGGDAGGKRNDQQRANKKREFE
jgi:hypothetical protein